MIRIVQFNAGCLIAASLLLTPSAWAQEATAGAAGQAAASLAATPPQANDPAAEAALVRVLMRTAVGDIRLGIDAVHAPLTAANFLHYVDTRRLDGITLYRAVKIDADGKYGLVQGGLQGDPKRVFKPVAHESPLATGLSHVEGAISMARAEPGTATSDFFIVVGELKDLDGLPGGDPGYAVFGHVVEGMDVVRGMLDLPRDESAGEGVMKGQMLASPVKVLSVRRAE